MIKKPLRRASCLDCKASFARCRALHRPAGTIVVDDEQDLLICPECGSYAVKETQREAQPE